MLNVTSLVRHKKYINICLIHKLKNNPKQLNALDTLMPKNSYFTIKDKC